jgi:peptidyl-dipeptidase Dcp
MYTLSILLAFSLYLFDPSIKTKDCTDYTVNDSIKNAIVHNPLLDPWTGSYGGVPPFQLVEVSYFKDGLESAMIENLLEIEKIATNSEPANFENTLVTLEKSGQAYERVHKLYSIWSSCMNSHEFKAVEREMAPKLAGFRDKIYQNKKLFTRIQSVYNSDEMDALTTEQKRLTWIYYNNFVRAGALLDDNAKENLTKINSQLANLFIKFSQNLLADENNHFLVLEDESELAGLPQSVIDAASRAAQSQGQGKWLIHNTRSSIDPFLTYSDRRDLREKAWKMFVNRGDNGDEHDNNAVVSEILQLRAQRAQLLGYLTHAHWRLENTMAKTPELALELMEAVWKPATERVAMEVADMEAIARKEEPDFKLAPWDYHYYAEKVSKDKYVLDKNEVKEYLQLENLREGMFWVAGELFNFVFTELKDIPVYHPDVRVWEVKDKTSSEHIGLWYFDPYARPGKRSGAWMNSYRDQQTMESKITTIVSNNSNFAKGKDGEPVLISWDDASTLFHEFGHALHGLSSRVVYPTLSGTSVVRDYVEFPSQLLEHWLSTPEVLGRFALHYKTGKPIPQVLVDRIENASTFNTGFSSTEALASALVDMKLHLAGGIKIDPDAFEKETLEKLKMPPQLVMRHRTPQFGHIFSGDGYSAGYYSYLWSDVLNADAYSAFTEAGGPYDKNIARKLSQYIFSVGNTVDPAEGYRLFRGRDPKIDALMVKRGFPLK